MIRIYHARNTRSVRVIWLCQELGLSHEVVPIDFSVEYRASAEWRALNPVGKVPVIEDGDLVMFESGAINQYLLDRYGDGRLQPPPGSAEHARYLQWCWFAESTLARPLGEIVNHGREFPAEARIQAVVEEMANRAQTCLCAVADAVQAKDYLLGSAFTAADIMMGYSIMLGHLLIPDQVPASLDGYWQRLSSRPGYQHATADYPMQV